MPAKKPAKAAPVPAEDPGKKPARAAVPTLRMKDLVDRVATASGAKKPAVKSVLTAGLAAIAAALEAGETLVLPPLGKASVSRTKDNANARTMMIKLKRATTPKPRRAPLAKQSDQG